MFQIGTVLCTVVQDTESLVMEHTVEGSKMSDVWLAAAL